MFALQYPDRLRSLTLACTTASNPPESRRQLETRARIAEGEGMTAIAAACIDRWFTASFRADHMDIVEEIQRMVEKARPEAYAAPARVAAAVNTSEELGRISARTLVIEGEHDLSTPADSAAVLSQSIRCAVRMPVPGAHLCNVESPEEFNDAVGDFLRSGSPDEREDAGFDTPISPW